MTIDPTFLRRCVRTLETAFWMLQEEPQPDDIRYDVYRCACVKAFELVLEQSGMLLKRKLRELMPSYREADALGFNQIFRQAAKFQLIPMEATERWKWYREIRNQTAHEYGDDFAEEAVEYVPKLLADAMDVADAVEST